MFLLMHEVSIEVGERPSPHLLARRWNRICVVCGGLLSSPR